MQTKPKYVIMYRLFWKFIVLTFSSLFEFCAFSSWNPQSVENSAWWHSWKEHLHLLHFPRHLENYNYYNNKKFNSTFWWNEEKKCSGHVTNVLRLDRWAFLAIFQASKMQARYRIRPTTQDASPQKLYWWLKVNT